MDRDDRTTLFIYGTLKRGHCRQHVMADQTFIGEAWTAPRYRLININDEYPGLIASNGDGLSIHGELWDVDATCMKRLDEIEGVDEGAYELRDIELLEPGVNAVAYFYLLATEGLADCGARWMGI